MRKLGRIVAACGQYTTSDGEEKTRWTTLGALFEKDNGNMSLKLDSIPVGTDWDGWASVFPDDEEDKPKKGKARRSTRRSAPSDEPDDDIPF